MRKQIRMSSQALHGINCLRVIIYGEGVRVTNGYIVSEAFRRLKKFQDQSDINLDWIKIGIQTISSIVGQKDDQQHSGYTTTYLTFSNEIYDQMVAFQAELQNNIGGRIHFSYCIKLIVYAALLIETSKINEYGR